MVHLDCGATAPKNFKTTTFFADTGIDDESSSSSSSSTEIMSSSSSPDDDLVAHYTFEEGVGTAVGDSSGNSLTGTASGGMGWSSGKCQNFAGSFDGSDDIVTISYNALIPQDDKVTVMAWVKTTDSGALKRIIYMGDGVNQEPWQLTINSGVPRFEYFDGTNNYYAIAATNVSDGIWHHICGVRNGSDFKIYIDGADDTDTTSLGAVTISPNSNVIIGGRPGDSRVNAVIDDVRIYDRPLDNFEINQIINDCDNYSSSSSSSSIADDLQLFYKFEEGADANSDLDIMNQILTIIDTKRTEVVSKISKLGG